MKRCFKEGRQGTGYSKLPLFFFRIKKHLFSGHILKYPEGSHIPMHKDPVTKCDHYRLNIVLKRSKAGGTFVCHNTIFRWWRFVLFRPDKEEHMVSQIRRGTRYVLSLGYGRSHK